MQVSSFVLCAHLHIYTSSAINTAAMRQLDETAKRWASWRNNLHVKQARLQENDDRAESYHFDSASRKMCFLRNWKFPLMIMQSQQMTAIS